MFPLRPPRNAARRDRDANAPARPARESQPDASRKS